MVIHHASFAAAAIKLLGDGRYCELTIELLEYSEANIVHMLDTTPEIDRNYILLFESPAEAGAVLETGYATGSFRQKRFVLLSSTVAHPSLWIDGMTDSAPVHNIMRLVLVAAPWPRVAADFFARWKLQTSTTGVGAACDPTTDDTGRLLYSSQDGSICAGLDFSAYTSISDLHGSAAADAYDAVLSAAIGLHNLLVSQAMPLSSSFSAYKAATLSDVNNVDISGTQYMLLYYDMTWCMHRITTQLTHTCDRCIGLSRTRE
jgi:hypothetical protein